MTSEASKGAETFKGHDREVTSCAWHPFNSRVFASGAYDGRVSHWLVGLDRPIHSHQAHEQAVWDLAFHPSATSGVARGRATDPRRRRTITARNRLPRHRDGGGVRTTDGRASATTRRPTPTMRRWRTGPRGVRLAAVDGCTERLRSVDWYSLGSPID